MKLSNRVLEMEESVTLAANARQSFWRRRSMIS